MCCRAMFDSLEIEKLIESNGNVTLIPSQSGEMLKQLLTAG